MRKRLKAPSSESNFRYDGNGVVYYKRKKKEVKVLFGYANTTKSLGLTQNL